MKTIAIVSVATSIVFAATIIAMYLNFTALVQQQSDLIKQQADEIKELRDALDNMIYNINDLWNNAPLPDIKTNQTAQESYFQFSD